MNASPRNPGQPQPLTHPARLSAVARLFGMSPAPVTGCRVLEVGCRAGWNLIPLAEQLPGSLFVGIDVADAKIAAGRSAVRELDLNNLFLDRLDVRDVPPDAGPFDYIIAHGVFSEAPAEVQAGILAVCRENLAPQGVAYVSHGTYPGRHSSDIVRDLLRYHTRETPDPAERVAESRTLLDFLVQANVGGKTAYGKLLREEQRRLSVSPDGAPLRAELGDTLQPLYFHEFMARAAAHGLQFLAEAEASAMDPARFGREVPALDLLGEDRLGREQHLDFLTNRGERRTLLCKAEVVVRQEVATEEVASLLAAASPALQSGEMRASSPHPLTAAAFAYLAEVCPRAAPFAEVEARARARLSADPVVVHDPAEFRRDSMQLTVGLLEAFRRGAVELLTYQTPLTADGGGRPVAPASARLQATQGDMVTTLRHDTVSLDPVARLLLAHLDGTRERDGLADLLGRYVAERGLVVQRHGRAVTAPDQVRETLAEAVAHRLRWLARQGLLTC